MAGKITFKGAPLTLVGRCVKIGSRAPDFRAVSPDLKEMTLADFSGKIKILTSFPSLDTPVCDLQVKEFNKKAAGFSPEVAVIGISQDLPFAQSRFCSMNEIHNLTVLSDYRYSSFGLNYGLLIKELKLLARSVSIVDKENTVRYRQVVPELTAPPLYDEVLRALDEVVRKPAMATEESLPSKCTPCEGGVASLPKEKVEELIAKYRGWEVAEGKKIVKEFKFKDFVEAKYFLDLVSAISEEQGHHPTLTLMYNKLRITLTTHAAGGLTENDFIMAKIIDELGVNA